MDSSCPASCGLLLGIHVFKLQQAKDANGRDKPGQVRSLLKKPAGNAGACRRVEEVAASTNATIQRADFL
jgi:hypothetical protein